MRFYDEKSRLNYSISNDRQNLYLAMKISDEALKIKIKRGGHHGGGGGQSSGMGGGRAHEGEHRSGSENISGNSDLYVANQIMKKMRFSVK